MRDVHLGDVEQRRHLRQVVVDCGREGARGILLQVSYEVVIGFIFVVKEAGKLLLQLHNPLLKQLLPNIMLLNRTGIVLNDVKLLHNMLLLLLNFHLSHQLIVLQVGYFLAQRFYLLI